MIQRHTLLINLAFSASPETVNASALTTVGEYQVNNVQGLGGGLTNSSNIRGFLADVNNVNDFVINDFFSYLTGSTTTIEFAEIYNSDQNLSTVFNDYYESSIVNNQAPSTSVIDNSLAKTTGITIVESWKHNVDGFAPPKGLEHIPLSINNSTRMLRAYSALTTYTNEESYYVPVFITRNAKQMAGLTFDVCDEIVSLILNQPQEGDVNPDVQQRLPGGDSEEGTVGDGQTTFGGVPPGIDFGDDEGETGDGEVQIDFGGGSTSGGSSGGGSPSGSDSEGPSVNFGPITVVR